MARSAVFVVDIWLSKQACSPTSTTNATLWVAFVFIFCSELLTRLELVTSSLPRKCSTTELQQHLCLKARAKVALFFIFAKFDSKKFMVLHKKGVARSRATPIILVVNLNLLPAECRFYDTEHQPRHKECNHNVEALCAEEGVQDIAVIL